MANERPPNSDMIAGYMDGLDPNEPDPGPNRSHSYRHGFRMGRIGRDPPKEPLSAEAHRRQADLAMMMDDLERTHGE